MTASQLTRAQDRWLRMLKVKPEWSYAETLHWVLFRSAETVGVCLQYGEAPIAHAPPDRVIAACEILAKDAAVAEPDPVNELHLALVAGEVRARAEPMDIDLPTRDFTPADWQHLAYREAGGTAGRWGTGGDWVDTRTPRDRHGRYMNMRFDRESVMNAFPSRDHEVADGPNLCVVIDSEVDAVGDVPADALNAPRLNRSARQWLLAPDVCEIANRRVNERGGNASREQELRKELKLMLREQNWNVEDSSVDTIRRDGGFKIRAQ